MSHKKIVVIGSGFAGLATAALLAKEGHEVTVLEKNSSIGGRARHFSENGFTFDMGPSWYWMPDVFENFFGLFGKKVSDYYELKKLSPSYTINFGEGNTMFVPDTMEGIFALFESKEPGAGAKIKQFLTVAEEKYNISMNDLVYKPSLSITEFVNLTMLKSLFRMKLFISFSKYVRQLFTHPDLLRLLEFPILFLGATPQNTPALYSIMNHAGLTQGTWYPMGGMRRIPEALESLSLSLGVKIATDQAVTKIQVEQGKTTGVFTEDGFYPADAVVAACDYAHTEQKLLEPQYRNYNNNYWDTRVLAPSALIFYVGLNTRVQNVEHHTLFFDEDFGVHAEEIYTEPKWPQKPLFYLCCPSVSDPTVAPEGKENLFVLIPVASGLEDSEEMREKYFNMVVDRMESYYGQDIRNHIEYMRSYCVKDFQEDYNALRGNAYGLANTLTQTAVLKPRIRNKKVSNLFYAGQLTVPGPGVPPSLISAQIAAKLIQNYFKK